MAFSYSDKNFTVIGNLCFVHIFLDGTKNNFDIPPAIAARNLISGVICIYPYITNKVKAAGFPTPNIGSVLVSSDTIYFNKVDEVGTGYLMFYFPIDSNK